MRTLLLALVLMLAGTACADEQDIVDRQIVLSARLCVFELGLRDAHQHSSEETRKPDWRALADFARQQLREIRRPPLACGSRWVRRMTACVASDYRETNIPDACVHRPLWLLTLLDQLLPLLQVPHEPEREPPEERGTIIRPD